MASIPVSDLFYEYQGERFRYRSSGDDFVRVRVEGELARDRFPDALEFSDDPTEPWVMLPLSAFTAVYRQVVSGRWHGAPVTVGEMIKLGLNRGLVTVWYAGDCPDEAVAAGFSGNQYHGWSAEVPPSEVEDIQVETTRQPVQQ